MASGDQGAGGGATGTGTAGARARIIEYEPGDLTVVVEPAMRLSELRAALEPPRQRLSLDPPGDPTIGECLLEDLSGPLRQRFGTMRDLVLGVSVVLGDGLRAHSGGEVVKNVAGYDLGKLFCGSRGRLGSLERLALRLHPLPAAARSIVTDAARWLELHHSQLVPSAADIVGGELHVLLEGSPRAVEAQLAAFGGEEADRWAEIRELQARLPGVGRWDGEEAPLVRPGPRVAYTEQERSDQLSPLAERIVEAMWTAS
jgi:FAD/FMN-containing dehydrogenase